MAGGLAQKILKRIGGGSGDGGDDSRDNDGEPPDPGSRWTVQQGEIPLHPLGGTYPRLARLADGGLLAVTTRHERDGTGTGTRILQVSRSDDGGRHFARAGEIARAADRDLDNGFLLEVPLGGGGDGDDGGGIGEDEEGGEVVGVRGEKKKKRRRGETESAVVLAAFRNHDLEPRPPHRPTHFRITVCRSRDGGRSWEFAGQAAEHGCGDGDGGGGGGGGGGAMGIWEPFMRLRRSRGGGDGNGDGDGDGEGVEVHLTYSHELARDDQETFRVVSRDAGSTWSRPPRCLRCHADGERLRDGMQGIARARDVAGAGAGAGAEALVMVFETTRHGRFSLEYAVSYDDGDSWGHRGVVYCPARPGRSAGSPQIASCRGPGGATRLAVVFMTDEDVDDGDGPAWPGKAAVKMVFADELRGGAVRWGRRRILVHRAPSFWPGVFCTGEGEVMATFEHGGRPMGKFVRFG